MILVMKKKLYRSRVDRVFAGLCGGVAEYFDVDSSLIRIFYLFITIFGAVIPGLLVYLLGILVVPAKPLGERVHEHTTQDL